MTLHELGAAVRGTTARQTRPAFVVTSDVTIDEAGARRLEVAFADRLGEVDRFPGFQRLEVWRDTGRAGMYVMVSWWDSAEDFTAYMRSEPHRRSHARIPTDPTRPRAAGVHRFQRIA
ncbi:MAG TPA: antibiotic biosynthesis monooxygenase [Actinoplanes sp.]|jgi:heme-degrading monooxygenase HmoA